MGKEIVQLNQNIKNNYRQKITNVNIIKNIFGKSQKENLAKNNTDILKKVCKKLNLLKKKEKPCVIPANLKREKQN